MSADYVRLTRARSPFRLALPVIGIGFAILGLIGGAPWIWFVPVGLFVGLTLYGLTRADAEFRLTHDQMRWRDGRRDGQGDTVLPLSAIERVEIVDWSDSTDYHVHRRDGARLTIPATVNPGPAGRLAEALTARGVAVERH